MTSMVRLKVDSLLAQVQEDIAKKIKQLPDYNKFSESRAVTQAEREIIDNIIQTSKKSIWITFQKVGFHYYPAAITEPQLADVSYLGNKHRHLFKFKVSIDVFHQDRELEFHQFLNFCESLFESRIINIDSKSCEMLADDLYFNIAQKYPNRNVQIEVSEDGEVGSTTQYLSQP